MAPLTADIAVIGSGPSGVSVACELARRGVSVALLTADDAIRWSNTYGVWADDLQGSPIADAVARSWSETQVVLSDGARELGRGYALLDNVAAIERFELLLDTTGVQRIHQEVVSLDHDDLGTTLTLAKGPTLCSCL